MLGSCNPCYPFLPRPLPPPFPSPDLPSCLQSGTSQFYSLSEFLLTVNCLIVLVIQLPRSALTLDEYRWQLDSYFFGDCHVNSDRRNTHSMSDAFLIECAKCDRFCSQTDYWTHIYGDHLRIAPFACQGYVIHMPYPTSRRLGEGGLC